MHHSHGELVLAGRDLLPSTHLLDGGDVDAELLVTAQTRHQIDVVGPAFGAYSHQRQAGHGDDLRAFVIDWEAQQARCPQGQTRVKWTPGRDVSGDPVVRIRVDRATCRACPARQACTWAKDAPANSPSGRKPSMRRSKPHGNGRRPPRSQPSMRAGQESRRRTRKASDAVACAGLVISGWPKSIASISARRWSSTWSGWASGGWARPRPKPAVPPLPPCGGPPPQVTASMNSPPVYHVPGHTTANKNAYGSVANFCLRGFSMT
jgi:hypothetical protein